MAAIAAVAIFIAALAFGAAVGETAIPLSTVAKVVANRLFGAGFPLDAMDAGIIWEYRLARATVAACCGMALALSGVVLQALLRNALADPYVLGISAGASTGAVAIAILGLGAGILSLSTGAFIGALIAFAVVALLGRAAGAGPSVAILAGVAGSQLFNALTAFIIARSANAEQARGIMFWLLGNLSGARWSDVVLAAPVVALGTLVCLWQVRSLDAFTFGADAAASLGVPVRLTQALLIGAAALMTAVMVSMVGSIGFVGLVIPHAARFLVGARHARLVPVAAIGGAVFLVACDVVARVIVPRQVVPIGVVTALVGAPAFALILVRARRLG